jgi:SAM-dependent methyltransferase
MQGASSSIGRNSLPVQIRVITCPEDQKFEGLVDRIETSVASALASSGKPNSTLVCQIVRLQDHQKSNDLCLPVYATPTLLLREGRSYICNPCLDSRLVETLVEELRSSTQALGASKVIERKIPGGGSPNNVSNLPCDFVLYIPGSIFHIRIFISGWRPSYESESLRFEYSKDGAPLWTLEVFSDNTDGGLSMFLSDQTLSVQYNRMKSGQTHGFSLLVRDFIRNAIALGQTVTSELVGSAKRKLYFPGIFDLSADVRHHYDTKVDRFVTQDQSEAKAIRKYNNLVKSILLNHFVPEKGVILDLACGHGQDLNKYRSKNPKLLIGTDISQAALTEARRRFKEGRFRYPAEFIQGNLTLPEIFEEVRRVTSSYGVTDNAPFDVISIQLALHYLVGSVEDTKRFFERILALLKPGGRFIATFPCCDRIARRLRNVHPKADFSSFEYGNKVYKVNFLPEELLKLVPSAAASVGQKSDVDFEMAVEQADFDEVSQIAANVWGAKYSFWLVDTIDNQDEFIVPLTGLEDVLSVMGMKSEMSGNFSEVLSHYTEQESPVIKDFKKYNPDVALSDDELEMFMFYRALVVKKA